MGLAEAMLRMKDEQRLGAFSVSHGSIDAALKCSTATEPSTAAVTTTDAVQVAVASSAASILTKSLLHPLDTLKCRVQIYSSSSPTAQSFLQRKMDEGGTGKRAAVGWRGAVDHTCVVGKKIRQRYSGKWGPRYLYGGLPVKLLCYVPYQAVYMTSYDTTRAVLVERYERRHFPESHRQGEQTEGRRAASTSLLSSSASGSSTPLRLLPCTMAAAVVAELSGCVVRVPMETVKLRIQSTVARGTHDALRQMRRNGFCACARLVVPQTLVHDIPYSSIQWSVYQCLRPQWTRAGDGDGDGDGDRARGSGPSSRAKERREDGIGFLRRYRNEFVSTFCSGGFSGLVAATLTLPLDNIRTRTVVATACDPGVKMKDVVWAAYRADGLFGFFRGGSVRVLWVTMNMACYFPLFELCRAVLRSGGGGDGGSHCAS